MSKNPIKEAFSKHKFALYLISVDTFALRSGFVRPALPTISEFREPDQTTGPCPLVAALYAIQTFLSRKAAV